MEIEKKIEEIKKIKAIFLEESIKIDKSEGRLIRKKPIPILEMKRIITTDFTDIKLIMRGFL